MAQRPAERITPPPSPAPDARPAPETAPLARKDLPAPVPPSAPTEPVTQAFLLPRFPCRLLWSPRKRWSVTTRLSDGEITQIFTEKMTKTPSLIRRSNNYF